MPSSSFMSDFEWDEGLTMPVANVENKHLEDEVQLKQRQVSQLTHTISEYDDRVHSMSTHLKNVRQELQHTQAILSARKHEIETEEHLKKIAEREEGRLGQEVQRLQHEINDLKEKKNMCENNIFKQTHRLEELKSQMNWDQQALEAWLEESARRDEDSMALSKYTRQDETKVKELSLRIEHLTDDATKKRQQLNQEAIETIANQIGLDKTAEEFRKAHTERQNLIAQWENTIEQMQHRDKEMDLLASQLLRIKNEVRQREETIEEKEKFLESEVSNNQEQEKKITMVDRVAARVRSDYQQAEALRDQFQNELESLKRTVDRTAVDLETTRSTVTHLKKEIVDKQKRLDYAQRLHDELVEKLKVASDSTMSAEERAAQKERLLEAEEQEMADMETELKRLRDVQFKKLQELHQVQVQERNTEAEVQGNRAALRNLSSKILTLDHESLKQQEIVYNQDFSIQQVERRISRMQGEQSNDEKVNLEARISDLTQELEEKTATHTTMSVQLKHLQEDVRRVKRDLEGKSGERADLTSKIEELNLHNDSSVRKLKNLVHSKQELMVDENILKLEIKRLREQLHNKSHGVVSLENRRLQLETAMKERRIEISIHKEILQAQIKAADEERMQINAELHERISKIDKLRKRYEILMVTMAPPDGEEERSQAYYVIKAAQEKEELQREGDALDAKIRKAEKEIRALENTLRLMNGRNEVYRKSFNKVTDAGDEMESKQSMEEQLRAVMDKFKYKRRQMRELQEDLQTMTYTLDNQARDEDAYSEMIDEKKNKLMQLNKEIEEQKGKIERVSKQNSKYTRELRASVNTKEETLEERDFHVREMREFNKSITKHVGEVVQEFPDLAEAVHLYFSQANLPEPPTNVVGGRGAGGGRSGSSSSSRYSSRPSSARSSSLSSTRSSISSHQSGVLSAAVTRIQIGTTIGETLPSSSRSSKGSARSGSSSR